MQCFAQSALHHMSVRQLLPSTYAATPMQKQENSAVRIAKAAKPAAAYVQRSAPLQKKLGSELTDASTSSFDTSSHSQSSADLAEDTSSASSEAAEEVDSSRRLQDLSEDDFDTNEEPEVDITEQYQQWLQAPDSQLLKGHPLKCKFCPDALLLNSTSLRQHLHSKKHKKLQPKDYTGIPVCIAGAAQEEESEGETHAERLVRIRQQSQPTAELTSSQRRRLQRKLKAQSKTSRPQKRCGKRQRAELKAQVFQQPEKTQSKPVTSATKTQKKAGKI